MPEGTEDGAGVVAPVDPVPVPIAEVVLLDGNGGEVDDSVDDKLDTAALEFVDGEGVELLDGSALPAGVVLLGAAEGGAVVKLVSSQVSHVKATHNKR